MAVPAALAARLAWYRLRRTSLALWLSSCVDGRRPRVLTLLLDPALVLPCWAADVDAALTLWRAGSCAAGSFGDREGSLECLVGASVGCREGAGRRQTSWEHDKVWRIESVARGSLAKGFMPSLQAAPFTAAHRQGQGPYGLSSGVAIDLHAQPLHVC